MARLESSRLVIMLTGFLVPAQPRDTASKGLERQRGPNQPLLVATLAFMQGKERALSSAQPAHYRWGAHGTSCVFHLAQRWALRPNSPLPVCKRAVGEDHQKSII